MRPESTAPPVLTFKPLSDEEIKRRINACPRLASLQSINRALRDLVKSEQSLNSRIADVIRRDPALCARLLRMVNSVYFGLSARVNNIEEAIFYLGLRQIRELAMATPVLEEVQLLQQHAVTTLPWKDLWAHSIGAAILTREILASTPLQIDDDTDYLVGLLHNVGKIVMAYAFPEELRALMLMEARTPAEFGELERALIGWDHAQIGAHYVARHQLSEEIVVALRHHNDPTAAPRHALFAAAVQVADHLLRDAGVCSGFENLQPAAAGAWLDLPGWQILYRTDLAGAQLAQASLTHALQRLPSVLEGLL